MRRTWAVAGLIGLSSLALGSAVQRIVSPLTPRAIVLRTLRLNGAVVAAAMDERSGHAFVATYGAGTAGLGHVVVLEAATGAVIRRVVVGPSPIALAVDTHVGLLCVVDRTDGAVRVLDTRTGEIRHTVVLFSGTVPVAAVVDEHADRTLVAGYIPGSGGTVSVIETAGAQLLRIMPLGLAPWSTAVDEAGARAFAISPASNAIVEFDTRGGDLACTFTMGGNHGAIALDARVGHLFVTNTLSATVSMVDVTKGALLRTIPVGKNPVALAVDERAARIIVIARGPIDGAGVALGNGTITEVDAVSGRIVRTAAVGRNPSAVAVDAPHGRVIVASMGVIDTRGNYDGAGRVTELDERTGATLRSVAVGIAPQYLALDERAGRVVVTSAGGTVIVRDAWAWVPSWLRRWLPGLGRRDHLVSANVTTFSIGR